VVVLETVAYGGLSRSGRPIRVWAPHGDCLNAATSETKNARKKFVRLMQKPQRRGLALTLARPKERVNSHASDVVALLFGVLRAAFTMSHAFAAASLSA
jgi:hypothetical protein